MNKISIPFSEFSFSFSRSGGAGGQNVNKVNSKVILTWKINETSACSKAVVARFKERFHQYLTNDEEVQIMGQKSRSQKANMDDCVEKLHEMLNLVATPPKIRRPTKPKKSAILKRLSGKKKDAEKKRLRKNDF